MILLYVHHRDLFKYHSYTHSEQLALLPHYAIVPLTWVVSGWASCVKWHCQCVGLMMIPDFDTKPAAEGAHRKRSFGNAQCIDFLWLGEINYRKKIPWVLLLLVLLLCKRGAFTVDGKNTQFTLWRVLSCLKNPFSFKQIRMTVSTTKSSTQNRRSGYSSRLLIRLRNIKFHKSDIKLFLRDCGNLEDILSWQ